MNLGAGMSKGKYIYNASLYIDAWRLYIYGLVITTEVIVDDVLVESGHSLLR